MPEAKRLEILKIWRPGTVNRARAGARDRSRVFRFTGFQILMKADTRISRSGVSYVPTETLVALKRKAIFG
jgi:hypothetical protein